MPRAQRRKQDFLGSHAPSAVALGDARQDFSGWLGASVGTGELLDDMLVVLSELMANAADASEEPVGDISVQAWIDADGLTLSVINPPASTFATANRWNHDDPLRARGRGLVIVESLVDDIAIAPPHGPEPLGVRCRRELPGMPT